MVMYLYAAVGVCLYGGRINTESSVLQDWENANTDYWAMNMNDMGSAMATLFAVFIGNNFQVFHEGYVNTLTVSSKYNPRGLIDESGIVTSVYMVSFYCVMNFGSLNILTSLVLGGLEAFKKQITSKKGWVNISTEEV